MKVSVVVFPFITLIDFGAAHDKPEVDVLEYGAGHAGIVIGWDVPCGTKIKSVLFQFVPVS